MTSPGPSRFGRATWLSAAACAALTGCSEEPPTSEGIQRVVVAVIDGVRMEESFAEGTEAADGVATEDVMPRTRAQLIPEGALVRPAWNLGVTITAPSHCVLTTGAKVAIGNFPAEYGVGTYVPDVPTLFETLAAAGRGRGWLIGNSGLMAAAGESTWPGLGPAYGARFEYLTDPESDGPQEDDGVVLDRVLELLHDTDTPLVVANLHAMDRAGHYGADGEYLARVEAVDAPLVAFWRAVQRDPELSRNTLVLVIADHGRHTHSGDPEEWRGHGDSCRGCRSIPMLWLGPGVRAGAEITADHTLEDAAATLGAVLGVPLPFVEGRPIEEAFTTSLAAAIPTGTQDVAAAAGHVAVRRWRTSDHARSDVLVDGEVWSSEDAWLAEAPLLATGSSTTVGCWRELALTGDVGALAIPWVARCRARTGEGDWVDIGYPVPEVSPLWAPAAAVDSSGALWMAASTNITGTVADATFAEALEVYRWTRSDGWTITPGPAGAMSYASSLALARTGGSTWVAAATSVPDASDGRASRHVEVWMVGDAGTWTLHADGLDGTDTDGADWPRRELPALTPDATALAQVGYGDAGTTVLVTTRDGATWSALQRWDPTGRVLAAVPPRWRDGRLWWARLDDAGTAEVCSATDPGEARCASTGAPWIRSLAPADGGAWISTSPGGAAWETVFVPG